MCVHTLVSMLFTSLTLVHCHLLFNLILFVCLFSFIFISWRLITLQYCSSLFVFVFYAGQVGTLDWNSSGKDAEIWREIELRERPTNELSSEGFLGRKASLYKAGQKLGRQMSRSVRDLPQFHKCWQKIDKGQFITHRNSNSQSIVIFLHPFPKSQLLQGWKLREIYTRSRFMS